MSDEYLGWNKIELKLKAGEGEPVKMVASGSIATAGIADGRLVPVIIVDSVGRPDIVTAVRGHASLGPGDVESFWYRPSRWNTRKLGLCLQLVQPVECTILIELEVGVKGSLIDTIIRAQGLYLQPGKQGDKIRDTMHAPRLMVEVPCKDIRHEWDKIYLRELAATLRARGESRREAKTTAAAMIRSWRQVTSQRM